MIRENYLVMLKINILGCYREADNNILKVLNKIMGQVLAVFYQPPTNPSPLKGEGSKGVFSPLKGDKKKCSSG